MLSVLVDLLFFLAGAVGIGAAVRAWRAGPEGRPVPKWGVVALYALAAMAFFSPALLSRHHHIATDIAYLWRPWSESLDRPVRVKNLLVADPPLLMLPFRELVRRRLLAGEPPLWAHELGTGQPLLGNAQSAPFAPLHLAALPLPPLRALTVTAAWQVVLGLLLMHVLLLRLRAPPVGAGLAAVAFVFSSFSVIWLYYPLGMAVMWIPGVLLGLLVLAEGAPRALPGLVACALGLVLSGHPSTMSHTALTAFGVLAVLWLRGPGVGRGTLLLRAAAAAALTFALSAPFVLPVLESLPASERTLALRLDPAATDPPDFEPRFAAFVLSPLVAGSPREGVWTAPWIFNEQTSSYAGLVTLVLAVAGAAVLRGRVLAILLGGLGALLAAFKIEPFHAFVDALPGLENAAHGRLRILWIVAVAIAAGLSLEALRHSRALRIVFAGLMVVALAGLVALEPPPAPWLRAAWCGAAVGGLAVLATPWALPRPAGDERRHRLVSGIVLAAVALDLGLLGIRYNPSVPAEMALAPPPVQRWLIERHREALASPSGPRPFRVLGEDWALFPNLPAVDGLWNALGFDPARPARAAHFARVRFTGGLFTGEPMIQSSERLDLGLLSFLGVRYLLTAPERTLPAPWKLVAHRPEGRVWENPRALPLFFMPRAIETMPPPEEEIPLQRAVIRGDAMQRALEIEDFARRSVVEATAGTGRATATAAVTAQSGAVRLTELSGDRFELRVESPTGGLVVSSVSHDPGWRVRVGTDATSLLRANGAFLAFAVPPGDHRAVLTYDPDGWHWGWALWLLGAAAVVGRFVVARFIPRGLR